MSVGGHDTHVGSHESPRDWNLSQVSMFPRKKVALPDDVVQNFKDKRVTGVDLVNMTVEDLVQDFHVPAYKAKSLKMLVSIPDAHV